METIKTNKKQTFKEYYDSKPEFRARHLEKMKIKVTCECGRLVNKAYMCKHLKCSSHIKSLDNMKSKPNNDNKHLELQKQIDELKILLEKQI